MHHVYIMMDTLSKNLDEMQKNVKTICESVKGKKLL